MSPAPDMNAAAKLFFTSPTFAVAGASSQPHKFGYKIFDWYIQQNLHAVPLNPTCSTITVRRKNYDTVAAPSDLPDPKQTSLSVITPPPVTAKLLQEAKASGVRAVWLQPGSFTDELLEYAKKEWPGAALGGYEDGGGGGGEGWCVLVSGEEAMHAAGRQEKL